MQANCKKDADGSPAWEGSPCRGGSGGGCGDAPTATPRKPTPHGCQNTRKVCTARVYKPPTGHSALGSSTLAPSAAVSDGRADE